MQITGKGVLGRPKDRDEAIRVLRRAVELGVDLIDTANSYGPYVSEELIREALHPYPKGTRHRDKGRLGANRVRPNGIPSVGRNIFARNAR